MKRNKIVGTVLVVLGVLLLLAAAGFVLYNRHDEQRAGNAARETLEKLVIATPMTSETVGELYIPDFEISEDIDMPSEFIEGFDYVGILDMPTIGIRLPVISECRDNALRMAPCCYSGSAYKGNFVIAGHNYTAHFGRLGRLKVGDPITFTDIDGYEFHYTVYGTEILDGSAVREMLDNSWDMTLFTCTLDRTSRITVRCTKNK